MIPIIGPIIDLVNQGVGMLRDHFEGKRRQAQAELETTLAIERAKQESAARISEGKALHEIDWEKTMAKASESSWKDEYVTIIISLPFLAAFFGRGEMATRAFMAMREAPEWYTYTFIAVFLAAIGIRVTDTVMSMIKKNGRNGA